MRQTQHATQRLVLQQRRRRQRRATTPGRNTLSMQPPPFVYVPNPDTPGALFQPPKLILRDRGRDIGGLS